MRIMKQRKIVLAQGDLVEAGLLLHAAGDSLVAHAAELNVHAVGSHVEADACVRGVLVETGLRGQAGGGEAGPELLNDASDARIAADDGSQLLHFLLHAGDFGEQLLLVGLEVGSHLLEFLNPDQVVGGLVLLLLSVGSRVLGHLGRGGALLLHWATASDRSRVASSRGYCEIIIGLERIVVFFTDFRFALGEALLHFVSEGGEQLVLVGLAVEDDHGVLVSDQRPVLALPLLLKHLNNGFSSETH
ncbi:hypothetical protein WR25_11648 [Diploscapter pachys]|uniref:Uncharacterized protein n=1 Tax=Diploscapter pachys TaxID=2018661 RepID=A0A2A2KTN1_9BILA|nr:hypothetical protein WR25_11648 [Diploscapter pachys]